MSYHQRFPTPNHLLLRSESEFSDEHTDGQLTPTYGSLGSNLPTPTYGSRSPAVINSTVTNGNHVANDNHPLASGNDDSVVHRPGLSGMGTTKILTLINLGLSNICSATFVSMLAPFFPTEAEKKHATKTEIGLIYGAFQLIVFVMSPVYGHFLTHIGAKFMYCTGIFITSSCAILFGFLDKSPPGTVYVALCFAVRSVEALGSCSTSVAALSIAGQNFQHQLAFVMGVLQACTSIGLMLGPLAGGGLFELGGFRLPFLVSGGVFMLCGLISIALLPSQEVYNQPNDKTPDGTADIRVSRLAIMAIPMVLLMGFINATSGAAMGFIDTALALELKAIRPNLSTTLVGVVFVLPLIVVLVTAPITGWITDKHKVLSKPFLLFGTLVAAIGFLIMGPSPILAFIPKASLLTIIIGICVSGLGWASVVVMYQECVTAVSERGLPNNLETKGVLSGVYNAMGSLGGFLGPIVGGVLYDHIGFGWTSTIVAAMFALGFTLLLINVMCRMTCSSSRHTVTAVEEDEGLIQH